MSDNVVRVSGPINAAGLEMTLETGKLGAISPTAPSWSRSAAPRCCPPSARRSPVRASTSSRSPSTSKSACTPRARSPARSSVAKAGRASRRSSRVASPTVRCGRRSRPTSATRCRSSRPSSVSTSRTRTTSRRSTARRPRSPSRASRSTVRSARCGSRTTTASGSRTRRSKRATSRTFEIVVAGRRLDDGDVAIMMVEAGGTERTWELYEEGAPKVTEELIAEGLEASKQWIGAADRPPDRSCTPSTCRRTARSTPIEYTARRSTTRPRCYAAVSEHAEAKTAEAMAIADKNERNAQLDEIEADLLDRPRRHRRDPRQVRRRGHRGEAGVPLAAEGSRRAAASSTKASASTVAARPTSGRCRPRSACCRPSHGDGLFQRGETQVLSVVTLGMPRMEQMLDTITLDDTQALHAPLQLPAVLHGRDRSGRFAEAPRDRSRCARRAGARAGASRRRSSGRTRCASSPTCSRRTVPRRWRRCAVRRCR